MQKNISVYLIYIAIRVLYNSNIVTGKLLIGGIKLYKPYYRPIIFTDWLIFYLFEGLYSL